MKPLPRILDTGSMPHAELSAAALDGDLVRVAEGWCARDQPVGAAERLAGVLAGMPRYWTAELATAAWVWGAGPRPVTLEVTFPPRRNRRAWPPGISVRHVGHAPEDLVVLDERLVTSPARTAIDLAQQSDRSEAPALVAELCALHRLDIAELAARAMARRRPLVERETAVRCLLGVQPLLTRYTS